MADLNPGDEKAPLKGSRPTMSRQTRWCRGRGRRINLSETDTLVSNGAGRVDFVAAYRRWKGDNAGQQGSMSTEPRC
jgi:hypothetical protein